MGEKIDGADGLEWQHPTMLDAMHRRGIFSIELCGDKFQITEECDQWFAVLITPEQLLKLADEIKALAEGRETEHRNPIPLSSPSATMKMRPSA